jgi:hypothetical protein
MGIKNVLLLYNSGFLVMQPSSPHRFAIIEIHDGA